MQNILLDLNIQNELYIENNFDEISSPEKQLIGIHGLGAYGGWFHELRDKLSQNGIASILPDLPGFGRSGIRGSIDSHKTWINSLQKTWEFAHKNNKNPEQKSFLLGHSLGGVLVLSCLHKLHPKPAGLIICTPGLFPHSHSYPFFQFTLPVLKNILSNNPERLVKIPFPDEINKAIESDSLDLEYITSHVQSKMFLEVNQLIFKAWLSINRSFDIPVLFILSQSDQTCLNSASEFFYKSCNFTNKKLINYTKEDNFGHDFFVNPKSREVITNISNWIQNFQLELS